MGRPDKVTVAWLKKAGWTSSNDPSMISVLKFVGIVGADGRPTELWDAIRAQDSKGRGRLATAVRKAYADLFSLYPDAHRKDAEALRNFFRANTSGGEQVQTKTVQTFQVWTEFGNFDAPESEQVAVEQHPVKVAEKDGKPSGEQLPESVSGISLNVNIQLQLPATSDDQVYERLFSAMRKHLMGLTKPTS
jgi:hypothetical protein